MKTAVASYQILSKVQETAYSLGGDMVVLHLRDFTYPVHYVNERGVGIDPLNQDKEIDVTSLATESLLKRLKEAQCLDKDLFTFQARRGESADRKVSQMMFITLVDGPLHLSFNGIVTHTYAYLTERKICLFLGSDITLNSVNKIDAVLSKLFPKI